jgi:hypothetical protein
MCLSELIRICFCKEAFVICHVHREPTQGRHRTTHFGMMRLAEKSGEHPTGKSRDDPEEQGDKYTPNEA